MYRSPLLARSLALLWTQTCLALHAPICLVAYPLDIISLLYAASSCCSAPFFSQSSECPIAMLFAPPSFLRLRFLFYIYPLAYHRRDSLHLHFPSQPSAYAFLCNLFQRSHPIPLFPIQFCRCSVAFLVDCYTDQVSQFIYFHRLNGRSNGTNDTSTRTTVTVHICKSVKLVWGPRGGNRGLYCTINLNAIVVFWLTNPRFLRVALHFCLFQTLSCVAIKLTSSNLSFEKEMNKEGPRVTVMT